MSKHRSTTTHKLRALKKLFVLQILLLIYFNGFAQNLRPELIENCLDKNYKCECLKNIDSSSINELAFSNFYLAIDNNCIPKITEKKVHLSQSRALWEKLDLKGFRYIYTNSYLSEYYYYQERNLDSLNHYHELVLKLDHDGSTDSYHNILESWRMKILSYADLGDYEGALALANQSKNSAAYEYADSESKAWFLYNLAEMLTNEGSQANLNRAIQYHQESIGLLPDSEYLVHTNYYGLGRIAIYQDELLQAENYLNQALNYFEGLNQHMSGICRRLIGDISLSSGNKLDAESNYINSIATFKKLDSSIEICDTYLRLAELKSFNTIKKDHLIDSIESFVLNENRLRFHKENNPLCLLKIHSFLGKHYFEKNAELGARKYASFAFETLHSISPSYLSTRSKADLKTAQKTLF